MGVVNFITIKIKKMKEIKQIIEQLKNEQIDWGSEIEINGITLQIPDFDNEEFLEQNLSNVEADLELQYNIIQKNIKSSISKHMSTIGKKGTGEAKKRGDSSYYSEMVKKRWEARKEQKKAEEQVKSW